MKTSLVKFSHTIVLDKQDDDYEDDDDDDDNDCYYGCCCLVNRGYYMNGHA